MTRACSRMEELILGAVSGKATANERSEVAAHVAQCGSCRALQEAMQRDDRQLAAYAGEVIRSLDDLREEVVRAIEDQPPVADRPVPVWRKFMRSRVCQLSAAASFAAAAVTIFLLVGTQTAWSQVVKALQDVQRVHLVITETRPNGKNIHREESWVEKPNRLRKEENGFIRVDDGVNRMVLDTAKKTAQLADSELAANPREINEIFKSVAFFQQHEADEAGLTVKLTALPSENDGTVLAYTLEVTSKSTDGPADQTRMLTAKLWVAAATKLPLRLLGELRGGPRKELMMSVEGVFNYDPIPAEVFSTAVPNGYTELPRKSRGALRGKVVDEQGKPVAGAVVYATATYNTTLQGRTDAQGDFDVKLPLGNVTPVFFPVFVAAYIPDVPDLVAWTVIQDPRNAKENEKFRRICPIPGDSGRCEVSTDGSSGHCAGAAGMVLKMEPATRVHGIVTDVDGKPVSGAQVNAYLMCSMHGDYGTVSLRGGSIHPRCAASTASALAVTDGRGRYELTNVPRFWDGVEFYMDVNANGFVKQSASFTMHGQTAPKEMSVQMYRAEGTVRGRVTNDRGEPLMGYRVCAVVDGVKYRSVSASTGKDGRFKLVGCPVAPGLKVRLLCDHPMDAGKNWPKGREFVYYPPAEAAIKYKQGETHFAVNVVAIIPSDTLTVILKDSQGRPIPHFPVELRTRIFHAEDWMNKHGRKRTDSQGVCVFQQVPHAQGMELYLHEDRGYPVFAFPESVTQAEKERIAAENKKYYPVMPPVILVPDRNEQTVEVKLLTWDERKAQKAAP